MAVSMTGYGRVIKQTTDYRLEVEIKTLNHRFSEYQIKLPRELTHIEFEIRQTLKKYINRGRAEVIIGLSGSPQSNKEIHINWDLLDQYYKLLKEIIERYHLHAEVSLSDLLKLEEVISTAEIQGNDNDLVQLALEGVNEAAEQLVRMRTVEGAELSAQLNEYISSIEDMIAIIEKRVPIQQKDYIARLRDKISELIQDTADETRVLMETAIFADKTDVSEELTRLHSHLSQFRETLRAEGSKGRKLDFIIQEMHREINTLGSKSNDTDISNIVVNMKVIVEKLREQVQNIE